MYLSAMSAATVLCVWVERGRKSAWEGGGETSSAVQCSVCLQGIKWIFLGRCVGQVKRRQRKRQSAALSTSGLVLVLALVLGAWGLGLGRVRFVATAVWQRLGAPRREHVTRRLVVPVTWTR
jgi:hypothetical protein